MDLRFAVKIWLITGLIMLFLQIIIGGITRLTGSGLSITKWEIVTGTIPPVGDTAWEEEFELYKLTPQYKQINQGMSLDKFKFIYFWEYFHRLWARIMGFVFLIPFAFFYYKKCLSKSLQTDLLIVVVLAALAASFGWIMVASGLVDRPWVNAYKLSLHLSIGISVFIYLFWTYLKATNVQGLQILQRSKLLKWSLCLTFLIIFQLVVGGLMSGMKAGLYYPTWPNMNGEFFPQIVFNIENWTVDNFKNYDTSPVAPAIVQFFHRMLAYLLVILSIIYLVEFKQLLINIRFKKGLISYFILLVTQVILGIYTVLACIRGIPVVLGSIHQAVGILLLTSTIYICYLASTHSTKKIE